MAQQGKKRKQLEHTIDHSLDPTELRRKADIAWRSYKERYAQYSPELRWEDPLTAEISFNVLGLRLFGGLSIETGRVRFTMNVPLPFLLFRKKAIRTIESEMKKWIDH